MKGPLARIDKVLNPRSAVLTHVEVLSLLHGVDFDHTTPGSRVKMLDNSKLNSAEKKSELIEIGKLMTKKDELSEVLELRKELLEIQASKKAFDKAVKEGKLDSDSMPKFVPTRQLKKQIEKSKKPPMKTPAKDEDISVWKKLKRVSPDAINKDALKDLEKNDRVVIGSDDDEEKIIPKKRSKNVIVSDDEDDISEVVHVDEPQPSSSTAVQIAEKGEEDYENSDEEYDFEKEKALFSNAAQSLLTNSKGEKPMIVFENGQVIAMTKETYRDLNRFPSLANKFFTDEAVNVYFDTIPANDGRTLEDKWRDFILPSGSIDKLGLDCIQYFDNSTKQGLVFKNSLGMSDIELLKDAQFKAELSKIEKPDHDLSLIFGLEPNLEIDRTKCQTIFNRKILSSLFSNSDVDIINYDLEVKKLNSERIRQKHRTQHSKVKVFIDLEEKALADNETKFLNSVVNAGTGKIRTDENSKDVSFVVEQEVKGMKYGKFAHHNVVNGVLKYLQSQYSAYRSELSVIKAYQVLNKYQLTFLEKVNFINMAPKDAPNMLCLLDDMGLRFSKEQLTAFQNDCLNLFPEGDDQRIALKIQAFNEMSDSEIKSQKTEKSDDECSEKFSSSGKRKRTRKSSKK